MENPQQYIESMNAALRKIREAADSNQRDLETQLEFAIDLFIDGEGILLLHMYHNIWKRAFDYIISKLPQHRRKKYEEMISYKLEDERKRLRQTRGGKAG